VDWLCATITSPNAPPPALEPAVRGHRSHHLAKKSFKKRGLVNARVKRSLRPLNVRHVREADWADASPGHVRIPRLAGCCRRVPSGIRGLVLPGEFCRPADHGRPGHPVRWRRIAAKHLTASSNCPSTITNPSMPTRDAASAAAIVLRTEPAIHGRLLVNIRFLRRALPSQVRSSLRPDPIYAAYRLPDIAVAPNNGLDPALSWRRAHRRVLCLELMLDLVAAEAGA